MAFPRSGATAGQGGRGAVGDLMLLAVRRRGLLEVTLPERDLPARRSGPVLRHSGALCDPDGYDLCAGPRRPAETACNFLPGSLPPPPAPFARPCCRSRPSSRSPRPREDPAEEAAGPRRPVATHSGAEQGTPEKWKKSKNNFQRSPPTKKPHLYVLNAAEPPGSHVPSVF
ncbi:hypothetical protein GN956_G9591 [Arapaima gigas]